MLYNYYFFFFFDDCFFYINDYLKATWQQEYEKYKDMIQEEVIL